MAILKVSDYRTPVALVTGGAKRVGRAMALQLAEMGFEVAIHYFRSETEALSLLAEIKGRGGKGLLIQADLDGTESATRLFNDVCKKLGTPSVVINNASVFVPERLDQLDNVRLQKNLNLHVAVPLTLSKLLLDAFKIQDIDSKFPTGESLIVNMLDQRVLNPSPGFVSYNASKWALAGITKSLAIELAPFVRINGIAPGPVTPPPNSKGAGFREYCSTMPLERGSSPAEIAHLLKYIVEAGAVTGQILANDGGQHLGYLSPKEALRNAGLRLNKG